jgi:hypothetical protein
MIAAVVALATPTAALACRCRTRTPAETFRVADAVVLARVEAAVDLGRVRRFRLTVSEAWKGARPGRIAITIARASCFEDLAVGRDYLLYLQAGSDGSLVTNRCFGNLPAERAGERLRALRTPATRR